ncbi:NRPS-like enzyme [Desarmillaria tabescens]|uniref:NRPS-like enzyme n=1 Tax=Armillaria tabescens TaxID=1929756 RepID=A0AA39JUX9_ARMTA|nr:NRPS-like enzyme [Desarmillaria tabescens]KAK0449007.1 NRPS-like enzyme [Desarmillaria tabescens]
MSVDSYSTVSTMKTSPGSSLTFTRPPLDGSLTYPEIFDYNAQHSPNHPVFQFYDQDHIQKITWSEVTKAIHAAGRIVLEYVPRTDTAPVVGVLANTDSITFLTVVAGIIRAGYTAFPISTRNSPAAVAHLLESTGCKNLFVSADPAMQEVAQMNDGINAMPTPTFEDLYTKDDASEPLPRMRPDWEQLALIMHSSGSTRFPSPIRHTHRFYMMHGVWLSYGDMDVCGHVLSAHGLPMYHLMGCWTLMIAASDGVTVALLPPKNLYVVPTPERVLEGIMATKCTLVFCVPHFYEAWAQDPAAPEILGKATVALFAGGPLSKSAGDLLVAKGVPLCPLFGSTETTYFAKIIPKETPAEGWEWFEWARYIDYTLLPVEEEENIFRVIIKENTKTGYSPAVFNTTIDGVKAYDTQDLFVRHPISPEMFKCYGRHDDQIIHSTGEKTNPAPIEGTITTDKRVAAAIMFGRSKFQTGVLISPAPGYEFDPTNQKDLAAFRASIWDTVSKANKEAPQHSRIFKEMIIVTHPSKSFTYTAKGTPRRPAILKAYSKEIEAAYEAVDKISASDIPAPQEWNIDDITEWIRRIVHSFLRTDGQISDTQDVFAVGVDSLIATAIRNTIVNTLRKANVISISTIRALPQNFVFNNPSISVLSTFVQKVVLAAQATGKVEYSEEDSDGENEPVVEFMKFPEPGETVVKLRKGKGEPPLIVLHGGGGLAFDFRSYPEKFRTAVWALQVTPDAPMTSLEDLVTFYRRRIKEKQPTGPYRFAGYSASSILVIYLARVFERNGDVVSQLAMLDHLPSLFLHQIPSDHPNRREEFIIAGIEIMFDLMIRDKSRNNSVDVLRAALNGSGGLPLHRLAMNTARDIMGMIADFCFQPQIEQWMQSMKDVKASVTVYVAENGAKLIPMPDEEREDLGTSRWLPRAKVVQVPGGHMEFLEHDLVLTGLQEGYL